jgi:hypothetical protein
VVAANVYLGAKPVVEALRSGARIIVTGRTTDAALILAPIVHEFGWAWDDWNRLAAGTVAGHILECGGQATGGNLTDWKRIPSMLDVGYPIVEVNQSGDFVVTKHPGTGGLVTRETVTEQLLYEIGDPRAYLTPDVSVDFTSFSLIDEGKDRVRVAGCRGEPPPRTLKISIVYHDGFRAVGTALVPGPDAVAKAERLAEMLWHRLGTEFADRRADCVGYRGCWGSAAPDVEPNEVVLRMGVADRNRDKVERFSKNFMGFALQGPPGLGVFGGRPDVQPRLGFWPALISRDLVTAMVEVRRDGERATSEISMALELPPFEKGTTQIPPFEKGGPGGISDAAAGSEIPPNAPLRKGGTATRVPLSQIAYTRSGDKGDHANIGVAARSKAAFDFLREALSADKVKSYYADLVQGDVIRYELPNLLAFNFILYNALGGGGTLSLRVDHQGKSLGQGLLLMELEVPEDVVRTVSVR